MLIEMVVQRFLIMYENRKDIGKLTYIYQNTNKYRKKEK